MAGGPRKGNSRGSCPIFHILLAGLPDPRFWLVSILFFACLGSKLPTSNHNLKNSNFQTLTWIQLPNRKIWNPQIQKLISQTWTLKSRVGVGGMSRRRWNIPLTVVSQLGVLTCQVKGWRLCSSRPVFPWPPAVASHGLPTVFEDCVSAGRYCRGLPLWPPMASRLYLETVCRPAGIAVASRQLK